MSKGKKQTQTQNTSQTGTSLTNTGASINRTDTPDVPDWVLGPFQDLAGKVAGLGNLDPASLVPGAHPLQQQAAAGAAALGTYPSSGGQPQAQAQTSPSGIPPIQAGGKSAGDKLGGLSTFPKTYDTTGYGQVTPGFDNGDDFGGGRAGTMSAGPVGGGQPMGSMPGGAAGAGASYDAQRAASMAGANAAAEQQRGAPAQPASSGSTNPWGAALDRLGGLTGNPGNYAEAADMARSAGAAGPNGYDPTLGRSTSYNATTGEAVGYDPTLAKGRGYDATGYGSTDYLADVFGGAKVGPAASVLDNLKAYETPYKDQIVNPLMADLDANAGKVRAQQDLDLAGSGAFGGSGAALTKSETEGTLARARASSLSPVLQDLFKTSAGMSEADAGRRQQTSLAQAGYDQEAGLTGAAARTGAARDNALLRTGASKDNAAASDVARAFGATADNTFAGRNQDATNNAASELAAAQNKQTGQNVEALNTADSTNAGARNTQTLANQTASNDAAKFGGAQAEAALQRRLDAAKGLTDITSAGDATQRANATSLADIAAAFGGDQRANISTQSALGDALRGIQGEQAQAPIQLTDEVISLLQKLGLDKFIGSKTVGDTNTTSAVNSTGSSSGKSTTQDYNSPTDTLGQALQIASLFAGSDLRIKRDIETHHYDAKGRRWVNFNYVWDDPAEPRRIGVIAQEVRETDPEAVSIHPAGFLMVDYARLRDGV